MRTSDFILFALVVFLIVITGYTTYIFLFNSPEESNLSPIEANGIMDILRATIDVPYFVTFLVIFTFAMVFIVVLKVRKKIRIKELKKDMEKYKKSSGLESE